MTQQEQVDPSRQELPAGLTDLPPGAELAGVLAGVDPSGLNGHDLIRVAPMIVKQVSHYQALLADVMHQVTHCPSGDVDSAAERTGHTNPWAHVDLAAALRYSTRKTEHELRLAYQLSRLPMLARALADGVLDLPRVRTIAAGLQHVDDEPARLLAGGLLRAGAGRWTSRQISERLRRAVLAFDPQVADKTRRHAQANRRVEVRAHLDGTVSVYAENLPADRVAAMVERVDAIARTAKRQGDVRSIHQLRADIVCDLVAGVGIGATPPAPVTNPDLDDAEDADQTPPEAPAEPAESQPGDGSAPASPAAPAGVVPLPGPRPGVVNVFAWLSTIAGWLDTPGELAGVGPVTAETIRTIIAKHPDLAWRLNLYDDLTGCDGSCGCDGTCHTGQLAWHGTLRGHGRTAPTTDDGEGGGDAGGSGFASADVAFIRARDRTCRGPQACPAPATATDTDHTLAKADGGAHTIDNGGPFCRREHLYKHHSGARLHQPRPGVFTWITQFGHTITVRPETPDDHIGPPLRDPVERLQRILAQAPRPRPD